MKKILVATLLLAMMILAGCGGEQSAKKIIIGIDDDFAPISFYNEENELVGFDVDLAKETCERMGVLAEFLSGGVDIIWDGLDITEDRKEYMIFSKPYMDDRQVMLVKKGYDKNIHSEGDLAGKVVGAQSGSTAENYINNNQELRDTVKDLKVYSKFQEGINGLENSDIEVFICDELVARYKVNKNPDQLEIIDVKTGSAIEVGIGFHKENVELRNKVQEAFDEMIKDGTAKKISEKWFNADLIKQ